MSELTTVIESPLDRLGKPFDHTEVKQRSQGGKKLDYISIDATIRRLNSVLGAGWDTRGIESKITPLEGGKYLAQVSLELYALGKNAFGVGADVASDADKAIKTALAEALKKAGHQFGIGLYLWDEEERDTLQLQREAATGDLTALKQLVFRRAVAAGASPTAEGVSEHYGLSLDALQDEATLRQILEGE
jgi:hypothetical protein